MRARVLRFSQYVIDSAVLALAFVIAFLLRFDLHPPTDMLGRLFLTMPYVVVAQYGMLLAFGVPRLSWRYVGLPEVTRIFVATTASATLLIVVRAVLGPLQHDIPYLRHGVIPIGTIAVDAVLMFAGITGVRVARRLIGERHDIRRKGANRSTQTPTILVGAGEAGLLVAKELRRQGSPNLRAIGFVDDDAAKHGTVLHGIPVLGATERLAELCARHGARQVLITMASAPGSTIRRIAALAEQAGIPVQIVPGLYDIVSGKVQVSGIRPVAIEDLLRRDPVRLDTASIAESLRDKVVLVTGAGGSIGSELCRQISGFEPRTLLLVERAENALFEIHRELIAAHPDLEIVPMIGDVTDRARIAGIFAEHRPNVVFHAAAHKHVPMMEWNPIEAVKNNVGGTRTVADCAHEHGTDIFVMVSTDKAVNPTSVMGATKRMAELYTQARGQTSDTRFVTVRFGNVLGSNGSVIPIFREQIARGGPVTVTHSEMRRYFMTIPEACQLVMQAATMGRGGEIFILDMGEPVRIVDLARDLISLSGLRAGEDIEIRITGVRPGEKLFEELGIDTDQVDRTRHEKIFVGREPPEDVERVHERCARLEAAVGSGERARVLSALRACVPEFAPPAPTPEPEHARSESAIQDLARSPERIPLGSIATD
jgi:FlaA1/EpsC-like NDP-sugar epimerase